MPRFQAPRKAASEKRRAGAAGVDHVPEWAGIKGLFRKLNFNILHIMGFGMMKTRVSHEQLTAIGWLNNMVCPPSSGFKSTLMLTQKAIKITLVRRMKNVIY